MLAGEEDWTVPATRGTARGGTRSRRTQTTDKESFECLTP